MARSSLLISLDTRTPVQLTEGRSGPGPGNAAGVTKSGRQLLRKIIRHLEGVLGGVVNASHLTVFVDGAQPVAATAVITCATVIATNTVTLGGVALTAVTGAPAANQFDRSGTDTQTATNLAAAINLATNNAIITANLEASNFSQTVTLSSCTAGTGVRIAGHDFIAVNGTQATALATPGDFDMSGTDTADATSLVNAINSHPVLCHQVFATSSAGVVTVRQRRGTSSLGALQIIAKAGVTPSGLSVGGTAFVAGTSVCISCKVEGNIGNAITVATSGATLAILGSATALAGGTGHASTVSPSRIVIGASAS